MANRRSVDAKSDWVRKSHASGDVNASGVARSMVDITVRPLLAKERAEIVRAARFWTWVGMSCLPWAVIGAFGVVATFLFGLFPVTSASRAVAELGYFLRAFSIPMALIMGGISLSGLLEGHRRQRWASGILERGEATELAGELQLITGVRGAELWQLGELELTVSIGTFSKENDGRASSITVGSSKPLDGRVGQGWILGFDGHSLPHPAWFTWKRSLSKAK